MKEKTTIPFYPVAMTRGEPRMPEAPLPEGFCFKLYEPGVEEDWCRIQRGAGAFGNMADARRVFESEFSANPGLLVRRMVFIYGKDGEPAATGALWQGRDLGETMERVHWVAVVKEKQGLGLGKALVARLMELYRDEGSDLGIYLTTQTTSYRAINIYRQFGFAPYLGRYLERLPGLGRNYEEDTRRAWQLINGKLIAYAGPGADINTLPPGFKEAGEDLKPLLTFSSEKMFDRSKTCKVFEIAAPAQSGEQLHAHDYSQIWYVTRGSCEHYVEGQKHVMFVGDAFMLPPKIAHSTKLAEDSSIICCEFKLKSLIPYDSFSYEQIKELARNVTFNMLFREELSLKPKFTFSIKGQRSVEKLMHAMLEEYSNAEAFFEDILHLQILELLLTFAREYAKSPVHETSENFYDKYKTLVEKAIHYIDEHYNEQLTLDEMCRISTVSKTYFCYLFKMLTQQTFIEYLMDRRISKAMELLRESDMYVTDIGQAVGFRDSTHFSRTFKKIKGISPREYRKCASD